MKIKKILRIVDVILHDHRFPKFVITDIRLELDSVTFGFLSTSTTGGTVEFTNAYDDTVPSAATVRFYDYGARADGSNLGTNTTEFDRNDRPSHVANAIVGFLTANL